MSKFGPAKKWTNERIEEEIIKLKLKLNLSRIPNTSELSNIPGLYGAITRTGGIKGWAEQLELPLKDPPMEYAVYKGDDFLFIGTMEYCATRLGLSYDSFRFMTYPVYRKRLKGDPDGTYVVKVGREGDYPQDRIS